MLIFQIIVGRYEGIGKNLKSLKLKMKLIKNEV